MNSGEMINRLNKVEGKRKAEEMEAYERNKALVIAECKKVDALLKKLREIRPVVRKLFEMNLVKYEYCTSWNAYMTNEVRHNWGFRDGDMKLCVWGCDLGGGGANIYVDIDTGLWTSKGNQYDPAMSIEDFATSICMGWSAMRAMPNMVKGINDYLAMVEKEVEKVA